MGGLFSFLGFGKKKNDGALTQEEFSAYQDPARSNAIKIGADPATYDYLQSFKQGSNSPEKTLDDQIYDKEQRLGKNKIGGVDRALDDRNWFQRATNLDANQNVLSQGLDLLGRIPNSMVGAIQGFTQKGGAGLSQHMLDQMTDEEVLDYADTSKRLQAGGLEGIANRFGNAGKTAIEDLKGQRNSTMGQVYRNLAEDGRVEDGNFDMSDIVGFGLDVAMPNPVTDLRLFKSSKLVDKIAQSADEAEVLSRTGENFSKTMGTLKKAEERKALMADTYQSIRNIAGKANEFDDQLDSLYKLSIGKGNKRALSEFSENAGNIIGSYANKADEMSKIFDGTEYTGIKNFVETMGNRRFTHVSPLSKGIEMVGEGAGRVMSPVAKMFKGKVDDRILKSVEELADSRQLSGLAREDFIAKRLSAEEATSFQRFKNLFNKSLKDPLRELDANKKLTKDMSGALNKRSGDFLSSLEEGFEAGMYPEFANKEDLGKAVLNLFEDQNMASEIVKYEDLFDTLSKSSRSTLLANEEAVTGLSNLEEFIQTSGLSDLLGDGNLYNIYDDGGEEFIRINKNVFKPENRDAFRTIVGDFESTGGENAFNFGKSSSEQVKQLRQMAENNPELTRLVDDYGNLLSDIRKTGGQYLTGDPNTYEAITEAGYTPHTRNKEVSDFMTYADNSKTAFGTDYLTNKDHLDSAEAIYQRNIGKTKGRAIPGTIEDANKIMKQDMKHILDSPKSLELFGGDNRLYEEAKKLFVDEDYFSTQLGESVDAIVDGTFKGYEAKVKETSDVLVASIFGNQKSKVASDDASLIKVIPKNARLAGPDKVEMTPDNINSMVDILKKRTLQVGRTEQTDILIDKFSKALEKGDRVVVEKSLAHRLDGFLQVDKPDSLFLGNQYRAVNNMFKRLKTSSLGFNERNIKGNFHNSVLAGMTAEEAVMSPFNGRNFLNSLNDVAERVISDGFEALTPAQVEQFAEYSSLVKSGIISDDHTKQLVGMIDEAGEAVARFGGKAGEVIEKPTSLLGKIKGAHDKWVDINMKGNQIVDDSFRMGTYLFAKENPAFALRMGVDNPIDMARLVNFDPRNLTMMESEYIRQVVPFYTFARQNMMFQLKNMPTNIDRYAKTARVTDKAWQATTGQDSSGLRGFERDNFDLPSISNIFRTPEEKAEGKYTTLKMGAPFTDVGELVDNPLAYVVGASAPQIKGLYEFMANKNTYTGRPIESYEGEMDPRYPWTKRTGHLMGMTGLDVPAKQLVDVAKLGRDVAQGNFDDAFLSIRQMMGSTGQGSFSKNEESLKYDQLRRLDALIAEAKRNGLAVPTKTELKKLGMWENSEYDNQVQNAKKRK